MRPEDDALLVFAPDGIGEVTEGQDLATLVLDAVRRSRHGPLQSGDVVVVTSKILSKAEGRTVPGSDRQQAISAESTGTLARRGETRIVRTRHGLTLAAAGVDSSNVARGTLLLLPVDPDRSARGLRAELERRTGLTLAVVVSDTAGRAWRVGQTDQAVGSAGLAVLRDYAGQRDGYGNDLQVTQMATADEVAAAAELTKGKLAGRPVAVVRGLSAHLDPDGAAVDLVRPPEQDMFGFGSREAVLAAALTALGRPDCYEAVLALDPADRLAAVTAGLDLGPELVGVLGRMLAVHLGSPGSLRMSG